MEPKGKHADQNTNRRFADVVANDLTEVSTFPIGEHLIEALFLETQGDSSTADQSQEDPGGAEESRSLALISRHSPNVKSITVAERRSAMLVLLRRTPESVRR